MNAPSLERQQRIFEAVPASARSARAFVGEVLRRVGANPAVIGDYELAVGELAANVIEHGDGSEWVVRIELADPQWWEVEVVGGLAVSVDPPLRPEAWQVADPPHASGRGLGIVRQLMDDVIAVAHAGRFSVRCRRRR